MKKFKSSAASHNLDNIVMNGHALFPEFNITFFSGYEFYFNRYYIYDDVTKRLLFVKMDTMDFDMKALYIKLLDEIDYKLFLIESEDYEFFSVLKSSEERTYYKVTYRKYLSRARRILLFGRVGKDEDRMVSQKMEAERKGDF